MSGLNSRTHSATTEGTPVRIPMLALEAIPPLGASRDDVLIVEWEARRIDVLRPAGQFAPVLVRRIDDPHFYKARWLFRSSVATPITSLETARILGLGPRRQRREVAHA